MLRVIAFLTGFLITLWANSAEPVAISKSGPKSPLSPEDSLRWFKLDEGLRIELAAAEPEVVDPVAVRFDERGRMWVAEYRDYPNGPKEGGKPLSRIKLLEDTDHDGRYETAHVFAEGLSFCNGIQPWKQGVIATMAGRVAYLKDTDGDHKADVVETWYTGFAEENPQLRVNHPRFALDNQIYVANGLRGGSAVDARDPQAKPVELRGHDLRFDPRTGKYGAVAGNGQFGLTFDDYANRFLVTNRNPLIEVMLEDRYTARNPNLVLPAVVHDTAASGEASHVYPIVAQAWTTSILHAGQFTAACGIDIYRGDLLPPEYYGNSFTCEPTGSLVHREVLQPRGASFVGKSPYEGREFLASQDSWFRPVYCEGGPDGALYVCDMYRAVIEHPQFMPEELKNRPDLRFGEDRGRIYRIVPKDFRCVEKARQPADLTAVELVALLDSPNAWTRETAQRLLIERGDASAVGPLKLWVTAARSPQGRVHALWTLAGLDELPAELLSKALDDSDPRVREQAVVLSEPHLASDAELLKKILVQAGDADARLRFQAALTLGAIAKPDDATLTALAGVLERGGDDVWMRAAVATAAPNDAARLLALVIRNTKPTDPEEAVRRRALLRELSVSASRQIDAEAAKLLHAALEPWETSDEGRRLILAVLAGLGKGLKGDWSKIFDTKQIDEVKSEVVSIVGNAKVAKEHRLDALEILATLPAVDASADEIVLNVVRKEVDGELRSKALSLVAGRRTPETSEVLLSLLAKQTPALRGQIFDALLSRPERVIALLDAMEKGRIKPRELDQARATRLLKTTNAEIKARAEKLLASAMPADRTKALEDYKQALALKADPHRGKEVFKKNCATCHKIGDVGIEVGPSIADLRTKTLEQVLIDVIQPNKAIDNNFVSYTVVTNDGVQYVGIIAAETPGSVTLKMPDGKSQSVLKSDIDEMASNGVSLMPEGIERNIPKQDMADVISFVKNWRYLDGSIPEAPGATKTAGNAN